MVGEKCAILSLLALFLTSRCINNIFDPLDVTATLKVHIVLKTSAYEINLNYLQKNNEEIKYVPLLAGQNAAPEVKPAPSSLVFRVPIPDFK